MSYCVISTPEIVCKPEDVRDIITKRNCAILLGMDFPACVEGLTDPKQLIGAPEEHLSDAVCEMLAAHGIMLRTPACNAYGKQFRMTDGSLLWNYAWADEPFSVLSQDELSVVAWDLRRHPSFVHYYSVGEAPEEAEAEPEFSQEEIEGMPWGHVLPPDHPDSNYYTGDKTD